MNREQFAEAKHILYEIYDIESAVKSINYKPTTLRDDYTDSEEKNLGEKLYRFCKKYDGFKDRLLALLQSEIDIRNRKFDEL